MNTEFEIIEISTLSEREQKQLNRASNRGKNRVIAHRVINGCHPRFSTLGAHLGKFKRLVLFGFTL